MSKVRTSASKKINLMALIRTLTISTTTFERMKEKFYGLQQTAKSMERTSGLHDATCPADLFVFVLGHFVNFKAMRYESTSLNRIVADKLFKFRQRCAVDGS